MMNLFYKVYTILVYIPLFIVFTAIYALCVVLVAPFSPVLASRWFGRAWGRTIIRITPARVILIDEDNLDRAQSYVVVANHLSQYDILALYGWLKLDLKWVIKKELRKAPFIGAACAAMGHVFLDRANREDAIKALLDLKRDLQPGSSLMIFPEGTRSRDGKLKRFKGGAFVTAKELGIPILPITIRNTDSILPPGGLDLHPGNAVMIIHPAIGVDTVRALSASALRDKAREVIAASLED